ncbi:DUF2066 domain-containing protein [Vibrio sp. AK197]
MRKLALLALAMVHLPAFALSHVDLYRTEVAVDQNESNAESAARIAGMKEVIVRASGDQNAVNNEAIQKALSRSSNYLAQFSQSKNGDQTTMRMVFNDRQIRDLFTQAQVPFWPANRPDVLVWLVEENRYDRTIAWEHSDSRVLAQVRQQAKTRGLPITAPVGDFDDITGIEVSDLWGGFVDPLRQASKRYQADAVLVVKAQGEQLRWTLYDQKPVMLGQTRQAPLVGSASGDEAATEMVNKLSDYFAKKASVVVASESSESLKVHFSNIESGVSFFVLENKLKALSSVASLDILTIQADTVTFNVHLLTSAQEFEQQVNSMGLVLQLEDSVMPSAQSQTYASQDQVKSELAGGALPLETNAEVEAISMNGGDVPVVAPQRVLNFQWQGQGVVPEFDEAETSSADQE